MIAVRGRGRRLAELRVGGIPPSDNDDPLNGDCLSLDVCHGLVTVKETRSRNRIRLVVSVFSTSFFNPT